MFLLKSLQNQIFRPLKKSESERESIDEILRGIRETNINILEKFTQSPDLYMVSLQLLNFFFIIYILMNSKTSKFTAFKFFLLLVLLRKLCIMMENNNTSSKFFLPNTLANLSSPIIAASPFDTLMKASTEESSFADDWDATKHLEEAFGPLDGDMCIEGVTVQNNSGLNSFGTPKSIQLEEGELDSQSMHQSEQKDPSTKSSNKRTNSNQGGKGGRQDLHLRSPTKARKIVNSYENPSKEYIKDGNRHILSGSKWQSESIR